MLKDKDFLKIDKYLEDDYFITCIISDRGLGKTHSGIDIARETTKDDGKFVIARLTYEVFKKFKSDIEKFDGWKCSVAGQNIKKDDKIIGYLASLNTYANAKGGTYNDVRFMLFDEFNEDVYIENAFAKFVMLVDSFKRHRKDFKCVLLGNMINKNNWFLNAMGLRINWKSEEDLIYYLPEYGVKIVVVGTRTYENVVKQRRDINKLASADPSAHAFYNEREFLNDDTDLITNFVKWVKPTFTPLFNFRYGDFKYLFGYYIEEDGSKMFFVDRDCVYFKDYKNLSEYSFDLLGNTSKNAQILEDDDIEDIQNKLFSIAKQDRLRYGSFDCFEDLKRFVSLGSLL